MINSLPADKIEQMFSLLSGEDGKAYALLCRTAAMSILGRIKNGASRERWEEALCYAAACLAFYRYTLARGADNTSVYKAGDVTLQNGPDGARKSAEALLFDALAAADGCLKHSGFCFKTV